MGLYPHQVVIYPRYIFIKSPQDVINITILELDFSVLHVLCWATIDLENCDHDRKTSFSGTGMVGIAVGKAPQMT